MCVVTPLEKKEKTKKKLSLFVFFLFCIFFSSTKKMPSILKTTSTILKEANVKSRREYASIVFRCMQQTSTQTNLTTPCFESPEDAKMFQEHVHQRLNYSVPSDKSEECVLLPPLFWQAKETILCHVANSQLWLMLYEQGPIIPVVRLSALQQTVMCDTALLNLLIRIYEALNEERACKANIAQVLQMQNVE